MYTSKKHTSSACAWQHANPDQSGSSINYNIIIILLILPLNDYVLIVSVKNVQKCQQSSQCSQHEQTFNILRSFSNLSFGRPFVIMSANISSEGQYTTFISFEEICSLIK